MDNEDLKRFKITGDAGDEYFPFKDKPDVRYHIIGEIEGRPATLLNTIAERDEEVSPGLHTEILNELIEDILRAVILRVFPLPRY